MTFLQKNNKCLDLHSDFAGKQRFNVTGALHVETRMDTGQHMLDHMMVHVEEPVAVHRIGFTDEVPAGRGEGRTARGR